MDVLGLLGGGIWYGIFLIIAISVIVAIHEYGHYIVGRWTGIHAEVFSLGFGPVLVSRVDKRGTKWQIAAVPFGGYVKFLGDADAASVRAVVPEGLSAHERRHTMAGAPLWARTLTVAAGPAANFLLTLVLLAGLLLHSGLVTDVPTVSHLAALPVEQPLKEGDRILALNGQATPDTESFGAALAGLPDRATVEMVVERDGAQLRLEAPHPMRAIIANVQPKSAAVDAGLRDGDLILKADGREIVTFKDLQAVIFGSEGKPVPLTVWRAGESFDLTLTPRPRDMPLVDGNGFENKWMIGVAAGLTFELGTRAPTLWEVLSLPVIQTFEMLTMTLSGLWHMVTGAISTCGMSGFVGIAETMGDAAKTGTTNYLSMLAVLSLGIGLMNLFPIPVLDGGHLVFYAYEAVTGKPPSDRALQVLMSIGFTLLISLMAFALLQDFICV